MRNQETKNYNFADHNTIKNFLTSWLHNHIALIPNGPIKWLSDQDKCINAVTHVDEEQCLDLLNLAYDGLIHIPKYETAKNDSPIPYSSLYLLDIADREDWETLTYKAYSRGYSYLLYGYQALHYLFSWRMWMYLYQGETLDITYVNFSDLISNGSTRVQDITDVKESHDRLIKYIQGIYRKRIEAKVKKKTGEIISVDIPEENRADVNSALGQALTNKNLPKDSREFLLAAMRGDKKIRYIPNAGASILIDLHEWQSEDAIKNKSVSIGIIPKAEHDNEDLHPYTNMEKITLSGQLVDLFKDPLNREIVKLKCDGYTEIEIAHLHSISLNTVTNRIQAIKASLAPHHKK